MRSTSNSKWQAVDNKLKLFNFSTITMVKTPVPKIGVNPYTIEGKGYYEAKFKNLDERYRRKIIYARHKYKCALCNEVLDNTEAIELHHVIPKSEGGTDSLDNLVPLHRTCHQSLTFAKKKQTLKLINEYK
jgi:5-methylcytosine-specific restriction endonuclease McrA